MFCNSNSNVPNVLPIKEIRVESPSVKTFVFDWDFDLSPISPGQFLMVWNFNDEKPMSVSCVDVDNGEISISVRCVGSFTSQLHDLGVGDLLGLRGPYGHGFDFDGDLTGGRVLGVGGGIGMAPVSCFARYLSESGVGVDVVSAAQTKDELLFVEDLSSSGVDVFCVTDDGSFGKEGFAVDGVQGLLETRVYDLIFICGPEIMMKSIFDLLEDYDMPALYSLERYMKCALGICGSCCVDKTGWRICMEGPVFKDTDIPQITEFNKYHRDATGTKKKNKWTIK